jgi:hypothetical protein
MDCARTVLAGPYRAPVAPRSALPGITRVMASGSMQAHLCHRSSPRVGSLAVSLLPRAQASSLGADEHIAATGVWPHILHGK